MNIAPSVGGLPISHHPPSPLSGLPALAQGPPGDWKGGRTTAGQFPAHMLRHGFPTPLIHHNMTTPLLYLDGSPFTSKGTPLQAHRSRSVVPLGGNGGGGGGGMTHERGGIDWGKGGRGWGTMCASEAAIASPPLYK